MLEIDLDEVDVRLTDKPGFEVFCDGDPAGEVYLSFKGYTVEDENGDLIGFYNAHPHEHAFDILGVFRAISHLVKRHRGEEDPEGMNFVTASKKFKHS